MEKQILPPISLTCVDIKQKALSGERLDYYWRLWPSCLWQRHCDT